MPPTGDLFGRSRASSRRRQAVPSGFLKIVCRGRKIHRRAWQTRNSCRPVSCFGRMGTGRNGGLWLKNLEHKNRCKNDQLSDYVRFVFRLFITGRFLKVDRSGCFPRNSVPCSMSNSSGILGLFISLPPSSCHFFNHLE